MPVASDLPVGRRPPYPAATFELSVLTLAVPSSGRPGADSSTIGLLRRARSSGITTFDLTEAAEPLAAETRLRSAVPSGDSQIVMLVRAPAPRGTSSPGPRLSSWAPAPPSESRPPGRVPGLQTIIEVDGRSDRARSRGGAEPAPTATDAPSRPFVVRCDSREDVRRAIRDYGRCLISGELSLLATSLARGALEEFPEEILGWIARDPFAGGRLDGSRFAPLSAGGRPSPPRSVRELDLEFAPVARYGFLALRGERTLAQAALRFVSEQPRVVSVVVPLPAPERWNELLGFQRSPPLTAEERRGIERLGGSGN